MNSYSEFKVNIFSNNRDVRKCQSFRTTPDDDDDTKGYDNTSTVSSKTAELTTVRVTARFGPKYSLKGLLNQKPPTRPRGYKTFFMLNSVEHEILNAHKYKNRNSAVLRLRYA